MIKACSGRLKPTQRESRFLPAPTKRDEDAPEGMHPASGSPSRLDLVIVEADEKLIFCGSRAESNRELKDGLRQCAHWTTPSPHGN